MPVKIEDLLRTATTHGASDLHLKVGAFPMMRIGGELHPLGDVPRLKPEDTLDMAFAMMTSRQKQRFKDASEVDIGYGPERCRKVSRQHLSATRHSERGSARNTGRHKEYERTETPSRHR
ncbi:MAG: hypothetical protein H0T77_06585 [Pyrinomonadaceae bacterium]|nr:hypothetical protein [Pyrinomonadaceae bacterium]